MTPGSSLFCRASMTVRCVLIWLNCEVCDYVTWRVDGAGANFGAHSQSINSNTDRKEYR